MNYIIVKNAHPSVQAMFWDEEPQNGIDISWSAVDTYTGQQGYSSVRQSAPTYKPSSSFSSSRSSSVRR